MPARYINLTKIIERIKPARIIEVGTCKGRTAANIIREAVKHRDNVEYYGFDLFDPAPVHELTGATPADDMDMVSRRLENMGAAVTLTKGDTKTTLPGFDLSGVELAFLDGGHSAETVQSDFGAIVPMMAPGGTILCDDYWNFGSGGCNALIDGLDRDVFGVSILEPVDSFDKPWGVLRIQMAEVTC